MNLNDLLEFKRDLYFDGAVQPDWFYYPDKAKLVSENFVFHGKKYFGVGDSLGNKRIDTISLTKIIGEKLQDEKSNPLSLAIADYGTGKSHYAVTLAQLLSGPKYMPNTFDAIVQNIEKIDSQDGKCIREIFSDQNLVLVINGMRDFNLHSELLKTAQRTLDLHGISDEKLRKINRSIETAEIFFDRNASYQIQKFEDAARQYDWREKGDALINRIKANLLSDENAFNIINSVYESMTGHQIRWDEGLSATVILEELVNDYCGLKGEFDSVIVLFDEFGRYLEYASSTDSGKSGDSALQQIFECSQNLEGKLQVVNFIQSDIKTYLQRVDNSKNISRYIGRFDISDKYYISSNLETVFANLIHRKNPSLFDSIVVEYQNKNEQCWKEIFDSINKWQNTFGIWADYSLFRKVIVEGIYPMHPLSTYMLSQLSDYLQNRSSLTLISSYINNNIELNDDYYQVLPEELLRGDLFTEMLSAEQEGKQSSQNCISYFNILRKYQDKLNENHFKVLRANLALRILRFRTNSLDEVKYGLSVCSGLSTDVVTECLDYLENEYGVLGYDDRAHCYDFLEESNGAYDYKIFKKRELAKAKFNPYLLSNNQEIIELSGNNINIETNFNSLHGIATIEWQFKQVLYSAGDITEKIIDSYIKSWKESIEPDQPKGQIIWVYVYKETSQSDIDKLRRLCRKLENTPIYLMMLNDTDNKLNNDLIEYDVLQSMDLNIQSKYQRHYEMDKLQNRERIKAIFNDLKKDRLYFNTDGDICAFKGRLTKELSKSFDTIYPNAIPFNFDALITIKRNIAPKQSKNFFTIVKLLLNGDMNNNVIHNQQIEIRNRIESLLGMKQRHSWKCLNGDNHIAPPENEKAKIVYDYLLSIFEDAGSISIKQLYSKLTLPPYGLNSYSFILMISVFLSNFDYCSRLQIGDKSFSPRNWCDQLFVKEGKIEFDLFQQATIIKVDAGEIEGKYIRLFKIIEENKDVDKVGLLENQLIDLLMEDDIPERFKDSLKLANKTLSDGKVAKDEWEAVYKDLKYKSHELSINNFYPGLKALNTIRDTNFTKIFTKHKYDYTDKYKNIIIVLKSNIDSYIRDNFDSYLKYTKCNEVERLIQFRNHNTKMINMLQECGYHEFSRLLRDHVNNEISRVDEIRDKQNLKNATNELIKKCNISKNSLYENVVEYKLESDRLVELYNKYSESLGNEANDVEAKLFSLREKIKSYFNNVNNDIESIFDSLDSMSDLEGIIDLIERCDSLIRRGVSKNDIESITDLKNDLVVLKDDINSLNKSIYNRYEFDINSDSLINKYEDLCSDITSEHLESVIDNLKSKMNDMERRWVNDFIDIEFSSVEKVYKWKENTKILPQFLNQNSLDLYKKKNTDADRIISENRITTAKFYYDALSDDEKIKFRNLIS